MPFFDKFRSKKKMALKQYDEINEIKGLLDESKFEVLSLFETLNSLNDNLKKATLESNDLDYKIKLSIEKGNERLSKKAIEKKLYKDYEIKSLRLSISYIEDSKSNIESFLNDLNSEYKKIITIYEDARDLALFSKFNKNMIDSISNFKKILFNLNMILLDVEEKLNENNSKPSISIDFNSEIENYKKTNLIKNN
ncbi:hypothetical protein U729_1698 [Clostridium baratii str. Sullivan]|uniref:Uncharacterized protein n=1 Tax=Clostridium baratii str. Sullivan TaxID=1415775 RepID=A0A0A7FYV9_9CLOT|nr:hypothetical protein [Clostridium baratii]AIY84768.1 hypothetical protein U729_1698 [Clostridium baratii str. Sullivan]